MYFNIWRKNLNVHFANEIGAVADKVSVMSKENKIVINSISENTDYSLQFDNVAEVEQFIGLVKKLIPLNDEPLLYGGFKDYANLTLSSFVNGRAYHVEHGWCKFALLIPCPHGLIKMLMGDSDSQDLRKRIFNAVQVYQHWQPNPMYDRVRYDSISNYWAYIGVENYNDELAQLRELVLKEVD